MNPAFLAIFAYAWWGFVPVYWKQLAAFSSEELILYRVLLSAAFLFPLYFWTKRTQQRLNLAKVALPLTLSGLLIGFNWYLYVWAVNHDRVVEASLGYFLNPLMNVALGTLLLKERMHVALRWACGFAAAGAALLAFSQEAIPWVALLLASSFAFYGLLRKQIGVHTISGTFFETTLLTIPATLALGFLFTQEKSYLPEANHLELWWLLLAGVITTMPLLAFAEAAKGMTLSALGFFQFLSPSIQFLLGVFYYKEPFATKQWLAFSLIWIGLGIFLMDLRRNRRSKKTLPANLKA